MIRRAHPALLVALVLSGCTSDDKNPNAGLAEPFRVTNANAQFVPGPLPGHLADAGGTTVTDGGPDDPPQMTGGVVVNGSVVSPWAPIKSFSGHTTPNGVAVAMALKGIGSGYWVRPTGDPDTAQNNELVWGFATQFAPTIEPGKHQAVFVALDENGIPGDQITQTLCVENEVPDNACYRSRPMPEAVISLTWDTNVDLDLQVLTPEKRLVEPKNPATADSDGGPLGDDVGIIDFDSNRACNIDSVRRENLVWKIKPQGRYQMYVNLFDACKLPAVRFKVEVYTQQESEDGGKYLKLWSSKAGELLDISANGGAARGLYVGEFTFN